MLRHVMTGAAAVLTVGMLAVGCSDDGDTITVGGNSLLNNTDSFPASSIFSNNVWHDGGGFSPNDADITQWRVIFSCDCCDSDGEFQGDGSAIVLFQVAGTGTSAGRTKMYVSHYNGSTFTPPVQLVGVDQDERVAPASVFSAVALQLNTTNYTTSVQADQGRVAGNDNNWVVLYSATTFTNNPNNAITQAGTVGSTVGPHNTIYYTAFRKESREINEEVRSDFIGTANPVTLRHGWSTPIEIVPANARSGVAVDTVSTVTPGPNTVASDVQSFGLVSDGYCGQTSFGGTGLPAQGIGGGAFATAYARAVPQAGAFRNSRIEPGERTQLVQLFYTQILNSLATGGTSLAVGASGGGNAASNGRLAAFNASLNLTTLQWENPAEFRPAAARNPAAGATTNAGTGFYPTFYGYNAHLFYKYMDASLNVGTNVDPLSIAPGGATYVYDNAGGHEGGVVHGQAYYEDICGVVTFVDDGDGTSSIITGSTLDLSAHNTTPGSHDLTNPTVVNNTLQVAPNREMQNYNLGGGFPFVFGADEGLGDTTVFYTSADNTRAGGADSTQNNIVRAGYAAAVNTNGTFVTGGTNPFVWSTHRGAHHDAFLAGNQLGLGAEDVKKDPLVAPGPTNGGDNNHDINAFAQNDEDAQNALNVAWYFNTCMNRTGEYVSVVYMQDEGTSLGFHRALKTVTYQPFRAVVGATGAAAGTQVAVSARFTAPLEISQVGAPVAIVQDATFVTNDINTNNAANVAEQANAYNGLPVNNFSFQDDCGYRCAIQSNNRIHHVLWEQSDGTEDRLFSRRLTSAPVSTGTPTAIVTGAIVEYDATPGVAGNRNSNDLFSFAKRSTFTFLDQTFAGMGNLASGDLGATDATGTNAGSLYVVFSKITDATSTDGDFGNAEVFICTTVADAITNRISLGRVMNEDQPLSAVTSNFNGNATVPLNQTTNPAQFGSNMPVTYIGTGGAGVAGSYQGQAIGGAYDTNLVSVNPVAAASPVNIAQSPTFQADALYIYLTAPHSGATNGSSSTALYTRKVNLVNFRANTAGSSVFNAVIVPSAGTTGPGSQGYLEPTRLDHNNDANVTNIQMAQNATSVVVCWQQDDHVWGQRTTDGENYLVQNGAPNPALVDQDSTADVINYNLVSCENGDGNSIDGMIGIQKFDFNGQSNNAGNPNFADLRLFFRGSLRVS